jgi:hypothetical protein
VVWFEGRTTCNSQNGSRYLALAFAQHAWNLCIQGGGENMLRIGAAVVACLALLGIALGAFFGARALVSSEEDPVERAKEASEADKAKPRFRGELGDFVIVEPGTTGGYPCPEPYQPATDLEGSELYFSLPGGVIDMAGSCQGTVISISMVVDHAMVGRGYFPGPKLEEPFDAPADRLKLITVGGKPALAELPIPDDFASPSQVVVIERFPSEEAPGITVWARTTNDLDKAIALAEEIMGVP